MINNKGNQDALYMLHLVCKVFYTCNQLQMSPILIKDDNLEPWFSLFKTILDMEVPPELATPTEDCEEINKRNKNIFWKVKGLAAKIIFRAYMKYGKQPDEKKVPDYLK